MPVLVGRFVHFIHSAALLQAVLQANTETVSERPSRNEEQNSRNEERIRKTPSSRPNNLQMKSSKLTCTFKHKIMTSIVLTRSTLMNFLKLSQKRKNF